MRELKFRAWDVDLKKMFYKGFAVHSNGGGAWSFDANWTNLLIKNGFVKNGNHKQKIIMQYTGLKDKHGKEIYEGDIVRCKWNRRGSDFEPEIVIEKIEFINGAFYPRFHANSHYEPEKIGNIYENPELLETNTQEEEQ